jgi:hypothetical protein
MEVVDWTVQVQDRDKWQASEDMVMNNQVPLNVWYFLATCVIIRLSNNSAKWC